MPFIFYAFSALLIIVIRLPVTKLLDDWRKKTDPDANTDEFSLPKFYTFASYIPYWSIPALVAVHFLLAGVICK
jgi:hypothetical protein